MDLPDVVSEAKVIEGLARRSVTGDGPAANELALQAQKILCPSNEVYQDQLNKQLAADRKSQGASLPEISIVDHELLTVKLGKGEEFYARNGAVMATGDDKLRLRPPRTKSK